MKRISTLLMALCLVLGTASMASALEVQVTGVWDTVFLFTDNDNFNEEDVRDHFGARSRFRPQVEFIASENLRGVLQLQIGSMKWGDGDVDSGAALDTTTTSAKVRRAYIDWNVADTSLNVRMGLQNLAFPSAVRGNPFFGANVAGVVANVGFTDEVSLSGFWARPFASDVADKKDNQSDLFGLALHIDTGSFAIDPWIAYASLGAKSGHWEYNNTTPNFDDESDVFAGGIAVQLNLIENLTIGFDAMYATLDNGGRKGGNNAPEGDGFYTALSVDYAMDWGTPGLLAWYSSGDSKSDRKKGKFGRMLTLGPDNGVALTRMGFMGSYGHGYDSTVSYVGTGTMGIALQIADMSFIEKLSHTARIAYYQGTNAKKGTGEVAAPAGFCGDNFYMTKKDYAIEVNFDTQYQIYENFTAVLELGWIYMDFDKKGFEYRENNEDENAYNANLILRYAF